MIDVCHVSVIYQTDKYEGWTLMTSISVLHWWTVMSFDPDYIYLLYTVCQQDPVNICTQVSNKANQGQSAMAVEGHVYPSLTWDILPRPLPQD